MVQVKLEASGGGAYLDCAGSQLTLQSLVPSYTLDAMMWKCFKILLEVGVHNNTLAPLFHAGHTQYVTIAGRLKGKIAYPSTVFGEMQLTGRTNFSDFNNRAIPHIRTYSCFTKYRYHSVQNR